MPPSSTSISGQHCKIIFAFRKDAMCSWMSLASVDASLVIFGVADRILTACTGTLDLSLEVLGGGVGADAGLVCCWAMGIWWNEDPMASSLTLGSIFSPAFGMGRLLPDGRKGSCDCSLSPLLGPSKLGSPPEKSIRSTQCGCSWVVLCWGVKATGICRSGMCFFQPSSFVTG